MTEPLSRSSMFMMRIRALIVAALGPATLAISAAPTLAQGGPPLITEDPGTPGAGNWEINIASVVEQTETEQVIKAPLLDINYGLGERIQLKYEIPWVFRDPDSAESVNGLGNSEVGVKYRFLNYDDDGLSMSVYPQYSFHNPTSSDERGLVGDPELLLPMQVARPIGSFEVTAEFGRAIVRCRTALRRRSNHK